MSSESSTLYLPTPLAQVVGRMATEGTERGADSFLCISYVAEAMVKLLGISLYAGLDAATHEAAYDMAYRLVRADSPGAWTEGVRRASSSPLVGFLTPEFHPLISWLTRRRSRDEDGQYRAVAARLGEILRELGFEGAAARQGSTVRDLLADLALLRNKTRAHGAVSGDFFVRANAPFAAAVSLLLEEAPFLRWRWLHMSRRGSGEIRVISLRGPSPASFKPAHSEAWSATREGVHFQVSEGTRLFDCSDLLRSNRDCNSFHFPNGSFGDSSQCEFIDYFRGNIQKVDASAYTNVPIPPPPSETEGKASIEIQSNIFGNLPPLSHQYIERKHLQHALQERLFDRNHAIITLHGQGGAGKTSLALRVAHELSQASDPRFESIVWLSARDIDLRPSGPIPVKRQVTGLDSIVKVLGSLFEQPLTLASLSEVLGSPDVATGKGRLYVFDNFETFDDPVGLHEFLDTFVVLPNKALITSRERAFKADYPIEVRGMEFEEAREMMRRLGQDLHVEGVLTEPVMRKIYDYTAGHAYIMRVMLGEIAKTRQYVQPAVLMPARQDILSAVFERSFNSLSYDARRVFMVIGAHRGSVSDLALTIVLGRRGMRVADAVDECVRCALVIEEFGADGRPKYSVPLVARLFASKKTGGDPDRLLVEEDVALLSRFSGVRPGVDAELIEAEQVRKFIDYIREEAMRSKGTDVATLERLLEGCAEVWGGAWIELAKFREQWGFPDDQVEYALRRAVEEAPTKAAWVERARVARKRRDELTRLSSLLRAVDLDPQDVKLMVTVANEVIEYLDRYRSNIPVSRRGVYLASIRGHMETMVSVLDASGLSKLAWLFLLEGSEAKASEYAARGLQIDPGHLHCGNIVRKLRAGGVG